jgi:glutamate formiminotransferase / 5-formyltetrahydrofolate cyclo-ligase
VVLECVVNVSEGRDEAVIAAIAGAAGADLLDVHTDAHHHRSVLTLVGEDAPRRVASEAIARLDLSAHSGVHPRVGVVDVVPFVPLDGSSMSDAISAREAFMVWLASEHAVPSFRYGPERSLPDLRRGAFRDIAPDHGPDRPHPTAGASCVGARDVLVAYNLWLTDVTLAQARVVASAIRSPELRSLGLAVGADVQVSMNLIEPAVVGPDKACDLVHRQVAAIGGAIARAELVGLLPAAVLDTVDADRWVELDLAPELTIEARLAARDRA